MTNPIKISELVNVKLEDCTICKETGCNSKDCIGCEHCGSSGVEPVLVENPCICGHKEGYHSQDVNSQKYVCRGAYCDCYDFKRQLQIGEVFEVKCGWDGEYKCDMVKTFLPIRPVREGDLSKVWIVKTS